MEESILTCLKGSREDLLLYKHEWMYEHEIAGGYPSEISETAIWDNQVEENY